MAISASKCNLLVETVLYGRGAVLPPYKLKRPPLSGLFLFVVRWPAACALGTALAQSHNNRTDNREDNMEGNMSGIWVTVVGGLLVTACTLVAVWTLAEKLMSQ